MLQAGLEKGECQRGGLPLADCDNQLQPATWFWIGENGQVGVQGTVLLVLV